MSNPSISKYGALKFAGLSLIIAVANVLPAVMTSKNSALDSDVINRITRFEQAWSKTAPLGGVTILDDKARSSAAIVPATNPTSDPATGYALGPTFVAGSTITLTTATGRTVSYAVIDSRPVDFHAGATRPGEKSPAILVVMRSLINSEEEIRIIVPQNSIDPLARNNISPAKAL